MTRMLSGLVFACSFAAMYAGPLSWQALLHLWNKYDTRNLTNSYHVRKHMGKASMRIWSRAVQTHAKQAVPRW